MNDTFYWYVMRSAGIASWVLLTLTLIGGSLLSGRLVKTGRRWLNDMHPYLATLGLATLVLHIAAAIADSQAHLRMLDAIVPFAAAWEPLAMGLGVVAVWLLGAVQLTSHLRHRLDRRLWHRIHLTSYAMAVLMAAHSLAAGTDMANPLVRCLSVTLIAATATAAAARSRRIARGARSSPTLRGDNRAERPRRQRPTIGANPPMPERTGANLVVSSRPEP